MPAICTWKRGGFFIGWAKAYQNSINIALFHRQIALVKRRNSLLFCQWLRRVLTLPNVGQELLNFLTWVEQNAGKVALEIDLLAFITATSDQSREWFQANGLFLRPMATRLSACSLAMLRKPCGVEVVSAVLLFWA